MYEFHGALLPPGTAVAGAAIIKHTRLFFDKVLDYLRDRGGLPYDLRRLIPTEVISFMRDTAALMAIEPTSVDIMNSLWRIVNKSLADVLPSVSVAGLNAFSCGPAGTPFNQQALDFAASSFKSSVLRELRYYTDQQLRDHAVAIKGAVIALLPLDVREPFTDTFYYDPTATFSTVLQGFIDLVRAETFAHLPVEQRPPITRRFPFETRRAALTPPPAAQHSTGRDQRDRNRSDATRRSGPGSTTGSGSSTAVGTPPAARTSRRDDQSRSSAAQSSTFQPISKGSGPNDGCNSDKHPADHAVTHTNSECRLDPLAERSRRSGSASSSSTGTSGGGAAATSSRPAAHTSSSGSGASGRSRADTTHSRHDSRGGTRVGFSDRSQGSASSSSSRPTALAVSYGLGDGPIGSVDAKYDIFVPGQPPSERPLRLQPGLTYPPMSDQFALSARIHNIGVFGKLDTGASKSALTKLKFDQLINKPQLTPSPFATASGLGSDVEVLGNVTLPVRTYVSVNGNVEERETHVDFMVLNVPKFAGKYDMLIGTPELSQSVAHQEHKSHFAYLLAHMASSNSTIGFPPLFAVSPSISNPTGADTTAALPVMQGSSSQTAKRDIIRAAAEIPHVSPQPPFSTPSAGQTGTSSGTSAPAPHSALSAATPMTSSSVPAPAPVQQTPAPPSVFVPSLRALLRAVDGAASLTQQDRVVLDDLIRDLTSHEAASGTPLDIETRNAAFRSGYDSLLTLTLTRPDVPEMEPPVFAPVALPHSTVSPVTAAPPLSAPPPSPHPTDEQLEEIVAPASPSFPADLRAAIIAEMKARRHLFGGTAPTEECTLPVFHSPLSNPDVWPPVVTRPYPIPAHKLAATKAILDGWVRDGVAAWVDSTVPAYGQIFTVDKRDGGIRIVVNAKPINAVTRSQFDAAFTMPANMRDNIHALNGFDCFIQLDFESAFTSLLFSPLTSELHTYVTPWGNLRWLRGNFGGSDVPLHFQGVTTTHFIIPLIEPYLANHEAAASLWVDDGAIGLRYSMGWRLLDFLKRMLDLCQSNGQRINWHKSRFFFNEVHHIGVISDGNSVRIDPERLANFASIATPRHHQDLRHILGLFNYLAPNVPYNVYVPNYALLKSLDYDGVRISSVWTAAHTAALETLKSAILEAAPLFTIDRSLPVYVKVDASMHDGWGNLVVQFDRFTGLPRPLAYYSVAWNKPQIQWTPNRKEMFALIQAILRVHNNFMHGFPFVAETDHYNTVFTDHLTSPDHILRRWASQLLEHNVTIVHIDGALNIADAPSRLAVPDAEAQAVIAAVSTSTSAAVSTSTSAPSSDGDDDDIPAGPVVVPGHLHLDQFLVDLAALQRAAPADERASWKGSDYAHVTHGGVTVTLYRSRV